MYLASDVVPLVQRYTIIGINGDFLSTPSGNFNLSGNPQLGTLDDGSKSVEFDGVSQFMSFYPNGSGIAFIVFVS